MMKNMLFGAALIAMTGTAFAQTTVDGKVEELRNQGFTTVIVGRTLFGNTRLSASGPQGEREVIISRSGDIMRDSFEAASTAVSDGANSDDRGQPAPSLVDNQMDDRGSRGERSNEPDAGFSNSDDNSNVGANPN